MCHSIAKLPINETDVCFKKDVSVGNPSHCGLQSTKVPIDVVCDEVKIKVCSQDKSRRIILRVSLAMCA